MHSTADILHVANAVDTITEQQPNLESSLHWSTAGVRHIGRQTTLNMLHAAKVVTCSKRCVQQSKHFT